jgi:hypothetical protein
MKTNSGEFPQLQSNSVIANSLGPTNNDGYNREHSQNKLTYKENNILSFVNSLQP